MFRIFVTNDDGIYAEGLVQLARTLAPLSQMTIVAPESPRSAASHSITLHKPLRLDRYAGFPWPDGAVAGSEAYACSGSPSDCTMLGVLEILKDAPPHLIISGINDGQNLAEDVTYSGTVAGAMEGAILGYPAMSVSLDHRGQGNYATACRFLVSIIERLFFGEKAPRPWRVPDFARVRALFDGSRFLNINVPDLPLGEVKGLAACYTGFRGYKDVVQKMTDPRGRPFFWIAGERVLDDSREGSDVAAITEGYVTVTPLTWDLTDHGALELVSRFLRPGS